MSIRGLPKAVLVGLVLCATALGLTPAHASDPLRILVINSWDQGLPWSQQFMSGFESANRSSGIPTQVFVEYLDSGRFNKEKDKKEFLDRIDTKYADVGLDYVVAESLPAVTALDADPAFLSSVERIAVAPGGTNASTADLLVPVTSDYKSSIEEMLRVQNPQQLEVIADTKSPGGQQRLDGFQAALAEVAPDVPVQYLINDPISQTVETLAGLPPEAAVYYLLTFQDADGTPVSSFTTLQQYATASTAPVFSNWEILVGSGLTGGYLMSPNRVGEVTWDSVGALSEGRELPVVNANDIYRTTYDWQQLDRFGLTNAELGEAADLRFYEPTVWEQYAIAILITLAVLTLLVALSLLLWVANRRQRLAVHMLDRQQERLEETVQERTQELAAANERLAALSRTDELTGLLNRRGLTHELDRLRSWSIRQNLPYVLILVDIDYFHNYNETYGHPSGDQALKSVASALRAAALRDTDVVGRFGGEEFLLALSDADADVIADRIHRVIAELQIPHAASRVSQYITVSIGGLSVQDPTLALREVIESADQALLTAKSSGRNDTVTIN